MSFKNLNLLDDVVTSYDQTKTTITGRVSQKTIGGDSCLGPSIPTFADIVTDSTIVPSGIFFMSKNITSDVARVFIIGTQIAGSVNIIMYNHNVKTGIHTYVGRLVFRNPSILITTVFKGIEVLDSGTSGWKIFITCTNAILINGGLFLLNDIALTDFTPLGAVNIDPATGNNQKANYMLQDPANIGVNNLNVASNGIIIQPSTNKVFVHNGVSATHQYYVYDASVAPTFTESTITGTNANPGVFTLTSHGFNNNDPVLFKTTGSFSGLTSGTVYFARNVSANTFELSATSGGASINTTGTQSGVHSIGRAFGTTGSNFLYKTGNLPALLGTLLSNNYEVLANPNHASYGALVGEDCASFGTSTNLYLGKLSELTAGVTVWASLSTANVLGSLNQTTAVTPVASHWSETLDMFIMLSNTSVFYGKRLVNNEFQFIFGRLNTAFYETTPPSYGSVRVGSAAVSGITISNGILLIMNSTTGQRGMIGLDLQSDYRFSSDSIVSKVIDTPNSILKTVAVFDKLVNNADNYLIEYRTSGFGSISGGWISLDESELQSIALASQVQFKFTFNTLDAPNQTPSQLTGAICETESEDDISDNWEYSHDSSSNLSPTRVAFRLKFAYGTSIPSGLRFRAYDLSGTLLTNQTITSHPSNFEYSTDNGSTWLPLGTIPNTVGTLIRYTFTSPPGVDVRVSLRDS